MKLNSFAKAWRVAIVAMGVVGLLSAPALGNAVVNGDFETGDLTGWTINGTATTVSSTAPLAGIYSAVQTPAGGNAVHQTFTPFTVAATTSFIFSATDPGGAGDRSMNVYWRDTGGTSTINLRLVDVGDNGIGDVQIFDGAAWQTVLASAVTFNAPTSLTLTMNSYGVGANYDLTVNANTANGLSYFQNGALANLSQLWFVNPSAAGSTFKFDNVEVIPEPSTGALMGLVAVGAIFRRRLRK